MNFSKGGEALAAREIMELVQEDLLRVEREIDLESMASVNAVTTISQYLQSERRQAPSTDSAAAFGANRWRRRPRELFILALSSR